MNEINTLQLLVRRAETEFFPWLIEEIVIENDSQLSNMSDLLGIGKKIVNSLEESRKEEKQPFLDGGKAVDDKYKPVQSRVQLGVSRLDQALLTYYKKKKAEADALLEMQMQEEAKKIEECKTTGEVYEAAAAIIAPVGQMVRGNMSTTSVIQSWNYEIRDPDLVPRELCSPDMAKIKAKHKYDKLPVPGVLITPVERTQTRFS